MSYSQIKKRKIKNLPRICWGAGLLELIAAGEFCGFGGFSRFDDRFSTLGAACFFLIL